VVRSGEGIVVENLSDNARRVLLAAKKIAAGAGSEYVGLEHLLQALLELPGSKAVSLLEGCGADPGSLLERLRQAHAGGEPLASAIGVRHGPSVRAAVEIASLAARRLGHPTTGVDHLLLALLQMRDGEANPWLADLGVELKAFEARLTADRQVDGQTESRTPPQGALRRLLPRLDPLARALLRHAHDNAVVFQNGFVDIEHLLLGLFDLLEQQELRIPGVDWGALDLDAIRERIRQRLESVQETGSGDVQLTVRAQKALELAMQEAFLLGEKLVSPSHVLLGILGFEKGFAGEILRTDLARVRGLIIEQTQLQVEGPEPADTTYPRISLRRYRLSAELASILPPQLACKYRMIPLHRHGGVLTVALGAAPQRRESLARDVHYLTGLELRFILAEPEEVKRLVDRLYGKAEGA
jgi:ATP-dependent Clp protease ATP-binding subunit ClpA